MVPMRGIQAVRRIFIADVPPIRMSRGAKRLINKIVEIKTVRFFSHFSGVDATPASKIDLDELIKSLRVHPHL
jgi:hypothetical protein